MAPTASAPCLQKKQGPQPRPLRVHNVPDPRHQIRTRSSGLRHIGCPGFTPNAW
jgi:hypothetical protein